MTRQAAGRLLLFGCVVAILAVRAGWTDDLAQAATSNVSIVEFAFNPTPLNVNVGDTVIWTNNGSITHTTSSTSAVWDSGFLSPGQSFSFTFTSAGTFAYQCNIHPFMTGSIVVSGPAPTATFTPTPTSTPTPTPPVATGPAVRLSVVRDGANQLRVTVSARPGETLSQLAWTVPANAAAESLDGTPLPTGVTLPPGSTSTTFRLRRVSGQSVTLPIVVTGSFGTWRTFVGGGPSAW